jgi:hypothetical protein
MFVPGLPGLSSSLMSSQRRLAACYLLCIALFQPVAGVCFVPRSTTDDTLVAASPGTKDIALAAQVTHHILCPPPPPCRLLQECAHKRTSLQPLANVSLAGSPAAGGPRGSPRGTAQQQGQVAGQQHQPPSPQQQQPAQQQPAQQLQGAAVEQPAGDAAAAKGPSTRSSCAGGAGAAAAAGQGLGSAAVAGRTAGATGAAAAGAMPEGDDDRQSMDVS